MREISSVHNAEIKDVAALKQSKSRQEHNKFIAEGIRIVATIIDSGLIPIALYTTKSMLAMAQELTDINNITVITDPVMHKISQATTPSGILAVFSIPPPPQPEQLTPGLVIAQIADPGNMGTLLRTCVAMNIKSVVIIEGVDPWHPKVVQASAGTITQLKLFRWSWEQLLQYKNGFKLHALVVQGGQKPETITSDNALLIVGSEAHGIPEAWLAECASTITIPMPGDAESLNAAVAGAIALYEVFGKNK